MKTTFIAIAFLAISSAMWLFACDRNIIDRYQDRYLPTAGSQIPGNGNVKVTYLGATMLLFDDGQQQILIDGFITRPSVSSLASVQTDRNKVNAAIAQAGISDQRLKAIFTAHSHYDHTLDAAYISEKTETELYGSASTRNIGRGAGLPEGRMSVYQPGVEMTLGNFLVTVLPAKHSPQPAILNDEGQTIDQPLHQPAAATAYKEGGSYNFLIKNGNLKILVIPSANYTNGALDNIQADYLFLGTGRLGSQNSTFRNNYYAQTVAKVHPKMVIPIHWDNFFLPLSNHLEAAQDTRTAFDFLIAKLANDNIGFGILQGYGTTMLH